MSIWFEFALDKMKRKCSNSSPSFSSSSPSSQTNIDSTKQRRSVHNDTIEDNTPKNSANISDLPNELLATIFGHLRLHDFGKVEKVCRRWKVVACSLWPHKNTLVIDRKNINVRRNYDKIYGESFVDQLVAMKSIGGSLTALDLSEYRYCFGPMVSLSSLASVQCPHLSRLNLSHTKTPVAHFMQLIAGCGKLVELVLSHCSWLNDEALAVVFRSCALLSKLDVAHCYQLTGACFEHASDCLNTLRIDYCDKISDRSLRALLTRTRGLVHLSASCVHMTIQTLLAVTSTTDQRVSIELSTSRFFNEETSDYESLHEHKQLLGCIASLPLQTTDDQCDDNALLRSLLLHSHKLKHLWIDNCATIDDTSFVDSDMQQDLAMSDLNKSANTSANSICAPLEELRIMNCMITDAALASIARHLAHSLLRLEISCDQLSCEAICHAINELSSLTSLRLYAMRQVDNRVLEAALQVTNERLISIRCIGCVNIKPHLFKRQHPGTICTGQSFKYRNIDVCQIRFQC